MKCDLYGETDWTIVTSSTYKVYLPLKLSNPDTEILKLFKHALSGSRTYYYDYHTFPP